MKKAIGIDIGGTGTKAAIVNTKKGSLIGERIRIETPSGAEPKEVIAAVAELVIKLDPKSSLPVGICFPAIVKDGVTLSAANVDSKWIGFDARNAFAKALGRAPLILNDADAAGVAEMRFGAGKDQKGLVFLATLGTGIGTALFMKGKLIPNSELGHLEIDGVDYESMASYSAKEREGLDFAQWAKRLSKYFQMVQRLLSPDLVIIGGGISKQHEEFIPLIESQLNIVPAQSRNNAGIIGAAFLAAKQSTT